MQLHDETNACKPWMVDSDHFMTKLGAAQRLSKASFSCKVSLSGEKGAKT